MKIPSNREILKIAITHSSDVEFKDFKIIYQSYTAEFTMFFLVNDANLPSDNPLRSRTNLLK